MIVFHLQQIIGRRESQQDCVGQYEVSPQKQLFILADGMGGHLGGETASQAVVQAFLDYFQHPIADEPPADALLTALLRANAALQTLTVQYPHLQGMGTTLLAVLLRDDGHFDYVSVGDSPLYHWAAGSLKRINANHAFAEDLAKMVAAGSISAEEAKHHPQRHAITSALTGREIAHIDQSSGSLKTGERLLLASDGIHSLSDAETGEIATLLGRNDAAMALCQAVDGRQLPHQDNTSVIVVAYDAIRHELDAPQTLMNPHHEPDGASRSNQKIVWLAMVVGFCVSALLAVVGWLWMHRAPPVKPPATAPKVSTKVSTMASAPIAASAASSAHEH